MGRGGIELGGLRFMRSEFFVFLSAKDWFIEFFFSGFLDYEK
jgi:hypothetical protein